MADQKFAKPSRLLAALLAALLILSACTGPDADATPTGSGEPSQQETASPSPSAAVQSGTHEPSETPLASGTPEPSEAPSASTPLPSDPEPSVEPSPSVFVPLATGLVAEGESVEEDWFSDAVFVGDSRTDGLRLYSGIRGTSFLSYQGLSVFTISSKECIDQDGAKVTVMDALGQQQWAKVYLMLGVNELGYSTGSFHSAYNKVVQQIKELQPAATIYLQTLIPVNEGLCSRNGINEAINNEHVKRFNEAIAQVAEEENVALVSVDEDFWSPEGDLAESNTGDGVHLSRAGYVAWYSYLKSHTGTTPLVEKPPVTEPPVTVGPVSVAGEPSPSPAEPSPSPEEPSPSPEGMSPEPDPVPTSTDEIGAQPVEGDAPPEEDAPVT